MEREIGLFEAMYTARAIRRFRPDPVPDELIQKVVEAGTMAPSATNAQPWAFVVVRDPATKRFIQERYAATFHAACGVAKAEIASAPSGSQARLMSSVTYLADHLHQVPVLLLCCVRRYGPDSRGREGRPRYDSIFPAVENILLACRGLGLGSCLTTLHTAHEREINHYLGIPDDWSSPALLPIGFPIDRHGPIKRRPASEAIHRDRWS